jgi:hypothetical protein
MRTTLPSETRGDGIDEEGDASPEREKRSADCRAADEGGVLAGLVAGYCLRQLLGNNPADRGRLRRREERQQAVLDERDEQKMRVRQDMKRSRRCDARQREARPTSQAAMTRRRS